MEKGDSEIRVWPSRERVKKSLSAARTTTLVFLSGERSWYCWAVVSEKRKRTAAAMGSILGFIVFPLGVVRTNQNVVKSCVGDLSCRPLPRHHAHIGDCVSLHHRRDGANIENDSCRRGVRFKNDSSEIIRYISQPHSLP